jgi:hypothetical protein
MRLLRSSSNALLLLYRTIVKTSSFFLQSSCLSLYRTPFGFPTSFHSRPQGIAQTGSTHYRRQKIEKLFGILFAFIVADFLCIDLFSAVRIKFTAA